jgi:VanZ family protein
LPLIQRIFCVVFCGLALSVSIELIQAYEPGRVSALPDVYSNTIGTLIGAVTGVILFGLPFPWQTDIVERRPFVIVLIACWFGYRLFPYVPVIDLHKYWAAVKPLVFSPQLPPLDLYRHCVIWLALALLLEALLGTGRSRVALLVLVPAVLFARILIIDAELSPAEVVGGTLAALVWGAGLSRLTARAPIIAVLFAGVVAIQALEPFQFSAVAHSFGWVPFAGFMRGSIEVNVRSFFEKVFTYGTLTWLIARSGCRLAIAAGLGCIFVLCLRVSQVYIPGRSAEITDPIMLLIVAGVMQSMGENPAHVGKRGIRACL